MYMHPGTPALARSYALKAICFIALLSASAVVFSGQIYKWTDNNGRIHYGDEIPSQYKNTDESIKADGMSVIGYDKVPDTTPTRPATENHKSEARKKTADKQHTIVLNNTQTKVKSRTTCAAQWAAYNRSVECYNACSTHTAFHGKNISRCNCNTVTRPSCEM